MNVYLKLLLILTSFATCSLSAKAQFDDGAYYIYNCASNMYLGAANRYGTQASLTKIGQPIYFIKQSDGTYALDTKVFNSSTAHYLGSSLYFDSELTSWTIIEVSEDIYAFSSSENKYLSYDGHSTTLTTSGNYKTSSAQWKIISEKSRIASLKPGSDATFLIKDYSFSRNAGPDYQKSYWTIGSADDMTAVSLSNGNSTDNCASAYHTTFDVYQKLFNIPNGTYSLTCHGFYRLDAGRASYIPELYMEDENSLFLVSANGEENINDACSSFALELYELGKITATIYNGTLTIGTKLEKNKNIWCCWDNMRLTYVSGLNEDDYKIALNSSLDLAQSYLSQHINKDVRDSLSKVMTKCQDIDYEYDTLKYYVDLLNNTISSAEESASIYRDVLTHYNNSSALDEYAQALFNEKTAEIYESYLNGDITNGTEEISKLDSVYDVVRYYQITPGTDMTFAIVNPTIDGSDGWITLKPNGGNGPLLNGTSFEYWGGGSLEEEDRSFNYYQTITGIQNGKYTVSCEAYNSMNGVTYGFSQSSGIYATSGGKTVRTYVNVDSEELTEYTTPVIQVVDNTLTIGVRNFNTMVARWFVADNFKLTLIEPDEALGVGDIVESDDRETSIYTLEGMRTDKKRKGINIIKYDSGKTTKVYVK